MHYFFSEATMASDLLPTGSVSYRPLVFSQSVTASLSRQTISKSQQNFEFLLFFAYLFWVINKYLVQLFTCCFSIIRHDLTDRVPSKTIHIPYLKSKFLVWRTQSSSLNYLSGAGCDQKWGLCWAALAGAACSGMVSAGWGGNREHGGSFLLRSERISEYRR